MRDNNSIVRAVFYAVAVSLLTQVSCCCSSIWVAYDWCLPVSVFVFYSSYLFDEIYYRQKGRWYEAFEYMAWLCFIVYGWMGAKSDLSAISICIGISIVTVGLFINGLRFEKDWRWFWVIENLFYIAAVICVIVRHFLTRSEVSIPFLAPFKTILSAVVMLAPFLVSLFMLGEKFFHRCVGGRQCLEDVNPDVNRIVDETCAKFNLMCEELRRVAAQRVADKLLDKVR